jgi:hypothetical protein
MFYIVSNQFAPLSPSIPHSIHTLRSIRTRTTKARRHTPTPKRTNQRLNRTIAAQPTHHQGPQKVKDIKTRQQPTLPIPPHPPPPSPILPDILLRLLIKPLRRQHGALLDLEADLEEGREGVGEVADAEGADEGADVAELGDGAGHDEGEGPVDWDHEDPD